mgnify:CR=1 FL=1
MNRTFFMLVFTATFLFGESQTTKKLADYTVQKGDTLSLIADKHYGDKSKWKRIYAVNSKALKSENSLDAGQKLIIPQLKKGEVYWSQENKGLRISTKIKDDTLYYKSMTYIQLGFKNVSDKPIRIYLLQTPFFREFQVNLYAKDKLGRFAWLHVWGSRCHYTVTEKDFHLIGPSETVHFRHEVHFMEGKGMQFIKTLKRKTLFKFQYENEVTFWEGGWNTLNGPTLKLFDGKRIPYIWEGKLDITLPVKINFKDTIKYKNDGVRTVYP